MSQKLLLEYEVSVSGLEGVAASLDSAQTSAKQVTEAANEAQNNVNNNLPTILMGVRAANAMRLAVEQTAKAITDLNPVAALYAFLNIVQAIRNLISLQQMLKAAAGATAAVHAMIAVLTQRWWLIPLALAAAGVIYAAAKSMQRGGLVRETGIYLLHKGEYVVPREQISNIYYGPIFVAFEKQPRDMEDFLRDAGRLTAEKIRRGGF